MRASPTCAMRSSDPSSSTTGAAIPSSAVSKNGGQGGVDSRAAQKKFPGDRDLPGDLPDVGADHDDQIVDVPGGRVRVDPAYRFAPGKPSLASDCQRPGCGVAVAAVHMRDLNVREAQHHLQSPACRAWARGVGDAAWRRRTL